METKNVVIVLTVYSQYSRYYRELLAGLENYRRQGYQIALKFDQIPQDKNSLNLVGLAQADYIVISARTLAHLGDEAVRKVLNALIPVVAQAKSKAILQTVDDKKTDLLRDNSASIMSKAVITAQSLTIIRENWMRRLFFDKRITYNLLKIIDNSPNFYTFFTLKHSLFTPF